MKGRDLEPTELIRIYGGQARKRFGQNFLVNRAHLDRIVDLAALTPDMNVVEVGPGPGALTAALLSRDVRLTSVELDRDLADHLRRVFGDDPCFTLYEGDALKVPLDELLVDDETRVVANLPYNVATPILLRLVDHTTSPKRLVLMFQKEVADRICASVGSRASGWMTVALAARYTARIGLRLPPGAFLPPPKIDSAVIVLDRRETPLCTRDEETLIRALANIAFRQRRKTLRNAMKDNADEAVFEAAQVDPKLRCEVLDFGMWLRIVRALPPESVSRLLGEVHTPDINA